MGRGKRGKRARQMAAPCGLVLLDKPVGVTSRGALMDANKRLGIRASGHCGTLDPLASGLIVVCTGFATRVQDLFMGHEKTYLADLTFGWRSVTCDAEGPLSEVAVEDFEPPTRDELESHLDPLRGRIRQRPPAYSAIRVDGERLYKKARRGEVVEVPEREVDVKSIEVLSYHWPRALMRIRCGPGTYIRSLARDLGESLGCGAYLAALRRTQSGAFEVSAACSPDAVERSHLISLEDAVSSMPSVHLDDDDFVRLLEGRELEDPRGTTVVDDTLAWHRGKVMARLRGMGGARYRMKRLIVSADDADAPLDHLDSKSGAATPPQSQGDKERER
ncbi:MAG: tRNA pseudouridine(55) synthase TruB [Planctomycetota bacterium]